MNVLAAVRLVAALCESIRVPNECWCARSQATRHIARTHTHAPIKKCVRAFAYTDEEI